VRVNLVIGGFLTEKIDEFNTRLIYLVCSDPKGKIP
jgi:hypothetical protein